jgi:hypothetical protein
MLSPLESGGELHEGAANDYPIGYGSYPINQAVSPEAIIRRS